MFSVGRLLVFSFLNCYKKVMFKKWKIQTKTTKPSIKISGGMKNQDLLKPNFSQLLSCKTLRRLNYNFECLCWGKKYSSSTRPSLPSQIKNSLPCRKEFPEGIFLWKKEVLTIVTISLPLSMSLLGRSLPLFQYELHLSNPAEVGTRCGYRIVDEISIAVITMVQIKGETKINLSCLEEPLMNY